MRALLSRQQAPRARAATTRSSPAAAAAFHPRAPAAAASLLPRSRPCRPVVGARASANADAGGEGGDDPLGDPELGDPELEELLRVAVDRIKRKRAGLPDLPPGPDEPCFDDDNPAAPPSPSASASSSSPPGDAAAPAQQLLSRLRAQMRLQAAREGVQQEAREGAERLRRLGAELERELDESLRVEKFRAELEGGAALDSANAQLDELERELQAMREAARRGREEHEQWEERAAAARSRGLFFGSLHEGPITKKRRAAFKEEVARRKAEAVARAKGGAGGGGGEGGGEGPSGGGGGTAGGGGGTGGGGGGSSGGLTNSFADASSSSLLTPAYVPAPGADPSAVAAAIARQRLVARAAEQEAARPGRRALALAMAAGLLSLAAAAPPQAEPWRVGACAAIAAYVAAAASAAGGASGDAVRAASERRLKEAFGEKEEEEDVGRPQHRQRGAGDRDDC